jgi:hypothetical protein
LDGTDEGAVFGFLGKGVELGEVERGDDGDEDVFELGSDGRKHGAEVVFESGLLKEQVLSPFEAAEAHIVVAEFNDEKLFGGVELGVLQGKIVPEVVDLLGVVGDPSTRCGSVETLYFGIVFAEGAGWADGYHSLM